MKLYKALNPAKTEGTAAKPPLQNLKNTVLLLHLN
jgi:hypothetical protein